MHTHILRNLVPLALWISLHGCGDSTNFSDTRATGAGPSDSDATGVAGSGSPGDGTDAQGGVDGAVDSGAVDGGAADGGAADGGTADGGAADGGTADGGTDGGAADGGGDGEVLVIDTPETVMELCATRPVQTTTRELNFPARNNCRWNENGNLGRLNDYLQARETTSASLSVDPGIVVCGLSIRSEEDNFRYDDTMFLTMDRFILVSSNDNVMDLFSKEDGLNVWDFEKIKGQKRAFDRQASYCLGGAGACVVPQHDMAGRLDVELDSTQVSELAVRLVEQTDVSFGLVATGDNDDGDCYHTSLNLNVDIRYVQP